MALPSRDQTFAYESCRDLVEKLDREIDRYREVAGNDEDLDGNLVHQLTRRRVQRVGDGVATLRLGVQ